MPTAAATPTYTLATRIVGVGYTCCRAISAVVGAEIGHDWHWYSDDLCLQYVVLVSLLLFFTPIYTQNAPDTCSIVIVSLLLFFTPTPNALVVVVPGQRVVCYSVYVCTYRSCIVVFLSRPKSQKNPIQKIP